MKIRKKNYKIWTIDVDKLSVCGYFNCSHTTLSLVFLVPIKIQSLERVKSRTR